MDNIEDLIIKYWDLVYTECNTVCESVDLIMKKLSDDEMDFVLDNWGQFYDMVDDSFHYGLSIDKTPVYESMEDTDLDYRLLYMELLELIVQHIIHETKIGLPPHESWEGFIEGGFGEEVVEYAIENLNLTRKDIIEDYFDKGYALFELNWSDFKEVYYDSQFEDEEEED
jgi:hypothetical protein